MEPLALLAAASIPAALAYSAWRKAPLSLTFGVSFIAVFALGYVDQLVSAPIPYPEFPFWPRFYADLAVTRFGPFHAGPWTYVTSMFLHGGFFHLVFNLLFMLMLGPLLEDRIGSLRWAVLYFAGGMVATFGFELLHLQDPAYALLGASGALSAIFGAFGRLYPRERIQIWIPIPLPAAPAIYYVVGFVFVQFLLVFAPAGLFGGIAWEAHVIGLGFGFAAAPLVMRIKVKRKAEHAAVVDPAALVPLATTRELRQVLDDLRAADLPEVRAAWLEKFAATAKCPECSGPLRLRRTGLTSTCGWRLRF